MNSEDIQVFRGHEDTKLDMTKGSAYVYEYQADQTISGGGLKPAALASASVVGKTVILI